MPDITARNSEALRKWIYDHSQDICAIDLSVSCFDCPNYYFDICTPNTDLLYENGNPVIPNAGTADPIP